MLNRINLYYFDESGFNLTPNLPYAWSIIGNTLAIPAKRGKNLNVLGFLDINNSKLFSCNTYSRVDTDVAIEVFEQFVKQIKRSTVVVLDNASIHTSKKFKAKLDEWKEKGLTLFYLPPYSPQLNPIEILWRFMKYNWIEFDAYESTKKMKDYVEKVINGYGSEFEICFG